jgi:hypothetical protein
MNYFQRHYRATEFFKDESITKAAAYWILKVIESETITEEEGNVTTNANVKAILTGSPG